MKDRVALVTGAGSGIGKAIASRLGEEGMIVGVLDINGEAAAQTVAAIEAAGGRADSQICDITDYEAVKSQSPPSKAASARPWALVNNAGWDKPMPFLKTTPDFWAKVVSINYMGPLLMTHAVVQGMVQRGGGRVIFIASDAGRVGSSGEVVYSGTKGATIGSPKRSPAKSARKNVTLNCVHPAPTNTPAMDAFVGTGEEGQKIRDAMVRGVPLGRIGERATIPDWWRSSPATTRRS